MYQKNKFVPFRPVNAYNESGGITPIILIKFL